MEISKMLFRSWYYFRTGYATYLTMIIALTNVLVTTYYLALKNIPALSSIFTSFTIYVIIGLTIGIPITILIGWIHLKRTPAWSSELDIQVEANPYYYKLPPGYTKEVYAPLFLELLMLLTKLLEKEELLNQEERQRVMELERKMKILIAGGYVGAPKRTL